MNLSKTKLAIFFITVLVLGWFLYPRELFLAFIFEGQSELTKAEEFYKNYLEQSPNSKFATERLAHLYNRMAEPEKAASTLKHLSATRKGDWELANLYLQQLEDLHDEEGFYRAELEIIDNFLQNPRFQKNKLIPLLEHALEYALWMQRPDDAYTILTKLIPLSHTRKYHTYLVLRLDQGLKKTKKMLAFLQGELTKKPNDDELRAEIASIQLIAGNLKEALATIEEGIRRNPNHKDYLTMRATLHEKQGNLLQAIADVKSLLAFTDFSAGEKYSLKENLAHLHFTLGQLDEAHDLYLSLLEEDQENKDVWLAVIDITMRKNNRQVLIQKLQEFLKIFPDEEDEYKLLVDLILDNLLKQQKYAEALAQTETYLHKYPRDTEKIMLACELHIYLRQDDDAARLLKVLTEINPGDFATRKYVAVQFYSMGRLTEALDNLKLASSLKSDDLETWQVMSEILFAQEKEREAKEAAAHVIALAHAQGGDKLPLEHKRMVLKTQGRLAFKKPAIAAYQNALMNYPKDEELRRDFIDLALDHEMKKLAAENITDFVSDFPSKVKEIRPQQARLWALKGEWDKAATVYTELVKESPEFWYTRAGLAQAYQNLGDWPAAIREFNTVATANLSSDYKNYIDTTLKELHREHDDQINVGYEFDDFGGASFMRWHTQAQRNLTKKFALIGRIEAGTYREGQRDRQAGTGMLTLKTTLNGKVELLTGVGGAVSDRRQTPVGTIALDFDDQEKIKLNAQADTHELRQDLPQALIAGALQDEAFVMGQLFPIERLVFSTVYHVNRSYLKNGKSSIENTVEPALGYIVVKDPYVKFGYQFTYTHRTNHDGFFTLVPLTPDIRAHYVTASIDHSVNSKLTVSGYTFLGEDLLRDLHLFEGDLWGLGSQVKWHVSEDIFLDSSYYFGRETLQGVTGDNHQVSLTLTVH